MSFRIGVESSVTIATGHLELIRMSLVYPRSFIERSMPPYYLHSHALNPDSPIFSVLQNSGDFFNGFSIGFLTYNVLAGVDYMQQKLTKRYIPQRVKQGISMLAVAGIVSVHEMGIHLIGERGVSDLNDIPMGIAGGVAYLGVNFLARKFADRVLSAKAAGIKDG